MSNASARESSHVHWLLMGSLSPTPTGRRFALDTDSFKESFAAAQLGAKVDVGPAIGAAGAFEVELSFAKLKDYSLKHVLASVPALTTLRKLADDLGGPSSRRPSPDAAVAKVVELVGDGPLAAELRKVFAGDESEATPEATPEAKAEAKADGDSDDLVGEMLAANERKAEATRNESARAVDSFISAIRGSKPKAGAKPTPAHRRARELVETAVFGAISALLNDPGVTEPEALWRGLKLVVAEATRRAKMYVEIVDVGPEGLEQVMRESLDEEPMNRPDAYFCFDRVEDPERLQSLASTAEDLHAPLVTSVGPGFFGVEDAEDVITALRDAKPDGMSALPERWAELTQDEVSRWLAVTTNDVVVASEGAGAARRTVLGSSVFAVAAMLAASFRHTASFARVLGKEGSLRMPGLREVQSGREQGSTVPTAAFVSIRAQAELGALGIIGLGSGRNSDAVVLSEIRTARRSKDAVPLPAQILTGRLVRFGLWVRDQIPAGSSRQEVEDLFEQAATVFLFPGLGGGAQLNAGVVEEGEQTMIRLVAAVEPRLAGVPFEVGFDLPLTVALAD